MRVVGVKVKIEDEGQSNGSSTTAATITNPQSIGIVPREVPNDPIAISNFDFDPENRGKKAHAIIAGLVIKLQRPYGKLSTKESQFVIDILRALSQIPKIIEAVEMSLRLRWILMGIIGNCPTTRKACAFPDHFQRHSATLLEKVDQDLSIGETAVDEDTDSSSSPQPTRPARKRARSTTSASTPNRTARHQKSATNHPLMSGMMRGITVTQADKRRAYKIADKSIIIDPNVAGHNGLQMGQWWPLRHFAFRDGAHGSVMSGIAGGERSGAFSVVVSSGYEGMDEDHGNIVHYSAPSSHTNVDPNNAIITHQTKALQRSRLIGRSVRLFRTAAGSWKHVPSRGIRYDGLYSVVRESLKHNVKGGAYLHFTLIRNEDQPDIDISRPTGAEKRAFDRFMESI
ncbi:hypothetical protein N7G274_008540 [Stereocaulon virgatum]|uniref:YDG domain-containing protein n=1 Tax=Stereocaulon virgatum TaxID=373712 RepID=A0ABR3ZYM0_9LECA